MSALNAIPRLSLFPRRRTAVQGQTMAYWQAVERSRRDFKRELGRSGRRWCVVTFKDGHRELACFRILRPGRALFDGRLCRGFLFPRPWTVSDHEHVAKIESL